MTTFRRPIKFILGCCLFWMPVLGATPIFAQNQVSTGSAAAERTELAAAVARAQAAEQEAAISKAADRIEDAVTAQAYNRFEIWTAALTGFFSVLIAVFVVYFGLRTEKSAGIAAAQAAREEVANARGVIEALLGEAKVASKAAIAAASEARVQLDTAREETERLREQARAATASAEASAQEADEAAKKARRGAEALARASERVRVKPGEAGDPQVTLTKEEAEDVKAGAEATSDKPDANLTVDEFKTQIGKAAYLDLNFEEALRLASLMETYHSGDDAAVSFALRSQGQALLQLKRYERALGVYADLIDRFTGYDDPEIRDHVLWAHYETGFILVQLERFAEAQLELEKLLPLRERLDGPEHENTLAVRHGIARAMLDRGLAEEAEQAFRSLIETRIRSSGPYSPWVLAARHELARAILEQGRPSEAEAELRSVIATEPGRAMSEQNRRVSRFVLARAIRFQWRAQQALAELRALQAEAGNDEAEDGSWYISAGAADVLIDLGRAADAEAELRPILQRSEATNGGDHIYSLKIRQILAVAILEQGRAEDAQAELASILLRLEAGRSPDHPLATATRYFQAKALLDLERPEEAAEILKDVISGREKVYGPAHHTTLFAQSALAAALHDMGRPAEAEAELRKIMALLVPESDPTGHALLNYQLADAALSTGNAEEAKRILATIPEMADHECWLKRWAARSAFVRAKVADALGDRPSASRWLDEAERCFAEIFPPDHSARRQLRSYVERRG
ncbi:MAG: tetratricopeptide repeat protein [Allosphingosinicella sp.]